MGQQQQLRQPMLSQARTGNGCAEYMKYQYQCYALWHQQQSNEYYAALMKYQQQQQQQQQYGQVQGGYRQSGTSNQCTVECTSNQPIMYKYGQGQSMISCK